MSTKELQSMTASDRGYRTGEALEQPERLATWPTVRREVLAALVRHGLVGYEVHQSGEWSEGRLVVERETWQHRGGVRRDTLVGLQHDAEALALSAVQALAAPQPCPCCASFPLLCEYHGAANVAALVAPVVEAPSSPRPPEARGEPAPVLKPGDRVVLERWTRETTGQTAEECIGQSGDVVSVARSTVALHGDLARVRVSSSIEVWWPVLACRIVVVNPLRAPAGYTFEASGNCVVVSYPSGDATVRQYIYGDNIDGPLAWGQAHPKAYAWAAYLLGEVAPPLREPEQASEAGQ